MPGEDEDVVGDKPGDETESGVTAADTPRTRGQANLAALPTRFSVKATLGEGGMGTVVEAYDRALGRDVAIKVLGKDAAGDASINARFVREARAAAQLRHEGIVQVHDIDPDGEYIVMELVKGEALSARIKRERKLPASEVRRIGGALLEALGVAHAAGIVHRDVKPANVLLGEKGEVKLSDFGVAFFGDSSLTMPGTRIGTPAYMAPEQLRARHVDARADVYAAGATLFEAATGKRLHDDDALKDVAAAVLAETGDATLANAIARAVKERVGDRFEDGTAFARAIDGPTVTEVVPAPTRVPRRAAFAAGVVVALGVGGAVVAMRGRDAAGDEGVGSGSAPVIKTSKTIALLPFVDTTANPLLDFAASGLPNLLGLELHEVPGVTVIGYYQLLGHVAGSTAPIAAFREAAVKIGADVIVGGELTTKGDRVHVAIRVETAVGEVLETIEHDTTVEQVPETVRTAAGQVARATVGRKVGGARVPTAFAADRELQLGIAALEREKLTEAIAHLRAAVHHAPDLKLAHYYLAVALYWNAPPAQPARDEIDKALALGLDEAQKGFLAGIRHIVEQDFAKGIALLQPLAEKYPTNKDILYGLFEALFHGGRPSEAMSVYRRLIKLQPRFRLALVHAFSYYVSHGDDPGTDWALALGDPAGDAYNRIWEPRVLIARRKYAEAIALLNAPLEAGAIPGSARDLQSELVTVYTLDDKLELAQSLVVKLGETNVGLTAPARLAFATVRGDAAGRARWRSVEMREIARQAAGAGATIGWTLLAITDLPAASKGELAEYVKGIDGSMVADYDRSLNLNLAQALLADALDDTATLAKLGKSQYPEVSETVVAALARRANDRKAAAAAMRRAIAASGDARFLIHMWFLLAGDLRALSDHSGVITTCDEVIRPRLFNWQWGSTIGDCLAWTADASEAIGKTDEARAAWTRILSLRTLAAPDDRLVRAAKAGLARLPKR